jgi:hypothetical protein
MVRVMGATFAVGVDEANGFGDKRGVEVGLGVLTLNSVLPCCVITGAGGGAPTGSSPEWQAAPNIVKHIMSRCNHFDRDVLVTLSRIVKISTRVHYRHHVEWRAAFMSI